MAASPRPERVGCSMPRVSAGRRWRTMDHRMRPAARGRPACRPRREYGEDSLEVAPRPPAGTVIAMAPSPDLPTALRELGAALRSAELTLAVSGRERAEAARRELVDQ